MGRIEPQSEPDDIGRELWRSALPTSGPIKLLVIGTLLLVGGGLCLVHGDSWEFVGLQAAFYGYLLLTFGILLVSGGIYLCRRAGGIVHFHERGIKLVTDGLSRVERYADIRVMEFLSGRRGRIGGECRLELGIHTADGCPIFISHTSQRPADPDLLTLDLLGKLIASAICGRMKADLAVGRPVFYSTRLRIFDDGPELAGPDGRAARVGWDRLICAEYAADERVAGQNRPVAVELSMRDQPEMRVRLANHEPNFDPVMMLIRSKLEEHAGARQPVTGNQTIAPDGAVYGP